MNPGLSREQIHHRVYVLALALLLCCLPLSRYLLSISQFLLAANWLMEGRFRERFLTLRRKPHIVLPALVFLVYTIGLLGSANLKIGFQKVINTLPLLVIPLVMGTSPPLSIKTEKWLLTLFADAVVVAALVCFIHYFSTETPGAGNFRKLSFFMLHIRFSLLLVMTIFIILYLCIYNRYPSSRPEKTVYLMNALFLTAFLFYLRSATGIVIFALLSTVFLLNLTRRIQQGVWRQIIRTLIAAFAIILIAYPVAMYQRNFTAAPVTPDTLPRFTVNGNRYTHHISGILENGNYTDLYICEPELERQWNAISTIPYTGRDLKGQSISETIKRYLTSKGLRKDSAGMSMLTSTDIWHIEKGLANYTFRKDSRLHQRLYETLWEIHMLIRKNYVQQHSFTQRLAFLKVACNLMKDHTLAGTGTGDVYDAMRIRARHVHIALDPLWEGKPHNQYAFFILAFGIPGFLLIALSLACPPIITKAYRSLLFNLFSAIMLISMLTLDTLESYDSIVFFIVFYCFFVFSPILPENNKA
jgi:hypothetical protein